MKSHLESSLNDFIQISKKNESEFTDEFAYISDMYHKVVS